MLDVTIRNAPRSSSRWLALATVALLVALGAAGQTVPAKRTRGVPLSPGDGGPATAAPLSPHSVAVDAAGNVFIADYGDRAGAPDRHGNRIRKVAADTGTISTLADRVFSTGFNVHIALDRVGNVLVVDGAGNRVRRIDAHSGAVAVIAGRYPGFSGDGGPA